MKKIMASVAAAAVMAGSVALAPSAQAASYKECAVKTPYVGVLEGAVVTVYDELRRETYVAVQSIPRHGSKNHRNPNGRAKVTNTLWLDTSRTVARNSRGQAMRKVRTTWSNGTYAFVVKGKVSKVNPAWKITQWPANKIVQKPSCTVKY